MEIWALIDQMCASKSAGGGSGDILLRSHCEWRLAKDVLPLQLVLVFHR